MKKSTRTKRGSKAKLIVAIAILVISSLFVFLNGFYIDILWFKEVGFLQVFFKALVTQASLGVPLFIVLLIVMSIYFKLLSKIGSSKRQSVQVTKSAKFLKGKAPYFLSLLVSLILSTYITSGIWDKYLEFANRVDFGNVDPVFGKDISFFIFELPFYSALLTSIGVIVFVLLVSTLLYSFLLITEQQANVRPQSENENIDLSNFIDPKAMIKTTASIFKKQVSIFGAIFLVIFAISTYLSRYNILYSQAGISYGASYVDVNIKLPFLTILSILFLVSAILLLIFVHMNKIKPLLICTAAMIGFILIGGLAQVLIQNYVVAPNEFSKEKEYLEHHIQSTLDAYNLNDVEIVEFDVNDNITADDIKENASTIQNIPINDYGPTLDVYNSLQSIRTYYQFNDVDVDRYMIDGEYRQVFISAREMNTHNLVDTAKTWINTYLKYTHGFGVAISPVNEVSNSGQPMLIAKDIPTISDYPEIEIDEPRIYFGESTDDYAVVKTKSGEFDYPLGNDNVSNNYDGTAGIKMSLLNKLSFSLKYGTTKFLFSNDITKDSMILINRSVAERTEKVAPFLDYDDPYIVVSEGKLYWMIDAMTTSTKYPYAQPFTEMGHNYIRNSIKVVVDAYNGDITYYIVDENDPLAEVYSNIYPDLFKSIDEMPTVLKEHMRYSETMFNVQSALYSTYHMTNANTYYNREDVWDIASQLYGITSDAVNVKPAYLVMQLPNRDKEEFMMMVPFTPRDKDNMVAWMTSICDGEDYGKLMIYKFSKSSLLYGPMQMEQRIDQNTEISQQFTLLGQQGSQVSRGNMLTIPVNNSILYVEPIYIQANSGENSLPEMKRVIVCYDDAIVMESTLEEGLAKIFGSGNESEDPDTELNPEVDPDTTPSVNPEIGTMSDSELLALANKTYNDAITAQKAGNWAAYGEHIDKLGDLLEQLAK